MNNTIAKLSILLLLLLYYFTLCFAADTFSLEISKEKLLSLRDSGDTFNATGVKKPVQVDLITDRGFVPISIEPHEIRAPGYRAELSNSSARTVDPIKVTLFRGQDEKINDKTFYRFALISDPDSSLLPHLDGFYRDGNSHYRLRMGRGSSRNYNVERLTESELQDLLSSAKLDEKLVYVRSRSTNAKDAKPSAIFYEAEIGTEADYEFTKLLGSKSSANAEILSILNAVDAIYRSQLQLTLKVVYQNAWVTAKDPYSGSDSVLLLNQFVNYWENNFRPAINFDLAHFWTGREIRSAVVGIAYVASVCTEYSYGLSQFIGTRSYDTAVAAHEIAHSFGANHDNCNRRGNWLMCPTLQVGATQFSPTSKQDVAFFNSLAFCLNQAAPGGGTEPPRNAPILSPIGEKNVEENSTLQFSISAIAPENGPISYTATSLPPGASLVGQNFSYTPPFSAVSSDEENKEYVVRFTATDSQGLSDSESVVITVKNLNRPPQLLESEEASGAEGTIFTWSISAVDPDGDNLTFNSISPLPAGMVLNPASGLISWFPNGEQAGVYELQFTVKDGLGGVDQTVFVLTIEDTAGVAPLLERHTKGDFDGDGTADFSIFRNLSAEWFTRVRGNATYQGFQFGKRGDIPGIGDYNGDRISDFAIYRPANNLWQVRFSGINETVNYFFGQSAGIPVFGGDYDGDGRDDLALYKPNDGKLVFYLMNGLASSHSVLIGGRGELPVVCDYDGDGMSEVAVFNTVTAVWTINSSPMNRFTFGEGSDIPIPNDYNGDGKCEAAVFSPRSGEWIIDGVSLQPFGRGGDLPVPADFDGDGQIDRAVWRPSEAIWYVDSNNGRGEGHQLGLFGDLVPAIEPLLYAMRNGKVGLPGSPSSSLLFYRSSAANLIEYKSGYLTAMDLPLPPNSFIFKEDFDGDGQSDTAVFYEGLWLFFLASGSGHVQWWGRAGDLPVSGDFDGDGIGDIGIYRGNDGNGSGVWYIIKSSNDGVLVRSWGLPEDQPIAADFNGDGWSDPAVWRPILGMWFVLDGRSGIPIQVEQWGLPGDIIRVADFDNDGRADKIVWRPTSGYWYVRFSGGFDWILQWGLPGDFPVPGSFNGTSTSLAVYRPANGTLYILSQLGVPYFRQLGTKYTDQPLGIAPFVAVK